MAFSFWPALKALRRRTQCQPAPVVAVDPLDLAPVRGECAAVAEDDHEHDRDRPDDGGEEVDILDQAAVGDGSRELRHPEHEAGGEHEERQGVDPVQRPLGAPEAPDQRPLRQ